MTQIRTVRYPYQCPMQLYKFISRKSSLSFQKLKTLYLPQIKKLWKFDLTSDVPVMCLSQDFCKNSSQKATENLRQ